MDFIPISTTFTPTEIICIDHTVIMAMATLGFIIIITTPFSTTP